MNLQRAKNWSGLLTVAMGAAFALCVQGCGRKPEGFRETRVSIKTSLPPGSDPTRARSVTFDDLVRLAQPPGVKKSDSRYEKTRIPAFDNPLRLKEGDIIRVRGYLHRAALMGDGDYNLRLTASADSPDRYIVIEIPEDEDVADRNLRPMVEAAREFVKKSILGGHDPERTGTIPASAPYVEITGQLYFNDTHVGDTPQPDKQGAHRAGFWEIHPGLKVEFAPKPEP